MKLHLQNIEGGMKRLEAVTAAEGSRQNSSWPFVTVPAFEVIGASVRAQTGFEVIVMSPVVSANQVDEWAHYSVAHAQQWLIESHEISIRLVETNSSLTASDYSGVSGSIMDLTATVEQMSKGEPLGFKPSKLMRPLGPYFPIWYGVAVGSPKLPMAYDTALTTCLQSFPSRMSLSTGCKRQHLFHQLS
jgi:hypothetical protein